MSNTKPECTDKRGVHLRMKEKSKMKEELDDEEEPTYDENI
jgi:hypothetical protein